MVTINGGADDVAEDLAEDTGIPASKLSEAGVSAPRDDRAEHLSQDTGLGEGQFDSAAQPPTAAPTFPPD